MRLALAPVSISVTTVTSVGELVLVMLQLWLICWFGQLLTNEGERVRQSCHNSPWTSQHPSYKQTLHVVMTRCNRPLCLTTGLYTVNMKTYSQILQAAYSYLNFLLSTHDRSKFTTSADTY
uniref:Odorant receptor n=1 Tax=Graphocephala atropunctata TaxID=36148 RepID=A0A1B6LLG2_9HEMI